MQVTINGNTYVVPEEVGNEVLLAQEYKRVCDNKTPDEMDEFLDESLELLSRADEKLDFLLSTTDSIINKLNK